MNWENNGYLIDGSGSKILVITPYLHARVFWSSMTKRDYKKEYKAFIENRKVGEYPTEEEAMKEVALEITKIKDALCEEKK